MRGWFAVVVVLVLSASSVVAARSAAASGEPPSWTPDTVVEITAFPGALLVAWPQASDDGELLGYEVFVDDEFVRRVDAAAVRTLLFEVSAEARIEVVAVDGAGNRSIPLGTEPANNRVRVSVTERVVVREIDLRELVPSQLGELADADGDGIGDAIDATVIGRHVLDDANWPSRRFLATGAGDVPTAGQVRSGRVEVSDAEASVLVFALDRAVVDACPQGWWHRISMRLEADSVVLVDCAGTSSVVAGAVTVLDLAGQQLDLGPGGAWGWSVDGAVPVSRRPVVSIRN